jgi:hypothetical protein
MELAFSPDLPAWICYGAVLLVAMFVAWRKVSTGLRAVAGQDTPPIWHFSRTWLLLTCYVAVPLLLFWLLDRTEAIHDTSFFAALIVAIAYERIMAGEHDSLKVGNGIQGMWSPFQKFIERTRDAILKQLQRAAARFDRYVVEFVLADTQRLTALETLASSLAQDLPALQEQTGQLQPIGASRQSDERRVLLLYAEVHGSEAYAHQDEWQSLLYRKGVIDRRTYWRSPRVRSRIAAIVGVVLTLMVLLSTIRALDHANTWNIYYLWRLSKANVTQSDLHRTNTSLGQHLATEELGPKTFGALTALLQSPELTVDRSDVTLALLVENRCSAGRLGVPLSTKLVDSLRTSNVDIRDRINQVLVFLAPGSQLSAELAAWNPTKGDAVVDLELRVNQWRAFWTERGDVVSCDRSWRKLPVLTLPVQPVDKAPSAEDRTNTDG